MKELSIEEKAKRYDEALENIKKLVSCGLIYEDAAIQVFSELKESEDEKIRKEILDYIIKGSESCYDVQQYGREKFEKWIAWLEKQGEQKPIIEMKSAEESLGIDSETYSKIVDECIYGEQKPADKVEPKFKVGDKIIEKDFDECSCGTIIDIKDGKYIFDNGSFIYIEEQGLWQLVEQKPAWTPMDEQRVENLLAIIEGHGYPGEVAWINSLKDRVQPKQEWSEEDMKMIGTLAAIFEVNYPDGFYKVNPIGTTNMQGIHSSEIIKWLKHLKDRYTWKPSYEQLKVLKEACDEHWEPDGLDPLYTLYQDLKKIREE